MILKKMQRMALMSTRLALIHQLLFRGSAPIAAMLGINGLSVVFVLEATEPIKLQGVKIVTAAYGETSHMLNNILI